MLQGREIRYSLFYVMLRNVLKVESVVLFLPVYLVADLQFYRTPLEVDFFILDESVLNRTTMQCAALHIG